MTTQWGACTMYLSNFQTYYPGDVISGEAYCTFSTLVTNSSIEVILLGREFTRWTETPVEIPLEGHHCFLEKRLVLISGVTHGYGQYIYPFTFALDNEHLPSSYECKDGGIIYTIELLMTAPFLHGLGFKTQIRIVAPVNFHKTEVSLVPLSYFCKKNYLESSECYGPILMKVHLEKSFYMMDEMIRVRVNLINMSSINIRRVQVLLTLGIQCRTFFPYRRSKTQIHILDNACALGVKANSCGSLLFGVRVPLKAELPNFKSCKLFRLSAAICVIVVLTSPHSNMEFRAPIKLGHNLREGELNLSDSSSASLQPPAEPSDDHLYATHDYRPLSACMDLPFRDSEIAATYLPFCPFPFCPFMLLDRQDLTPYPTSFVPNLSPIFRKPEDSASASPLSLLSLLPKEQSEHRAAIIFSLSSFMLNPKAPSFIPRMLPTEQSEMSLTNHSEENARPWMPSPPLSVSSLSSIEKFEDSTQLRGPTPPSTRLDPLAAEFVPRSLEML